MNKHWSNIDRQAELSGNAEYRLRQYQTAHNHKPILYNTVVRAGQIPPQIVKTKTVKKRSIKPLKRKMPVFKLED